MPLSVLNYHDEIIMYSLIHCLISEKEIDDREDIQAESIKTTNEGTC